MPDMEIRSYAESDQDAVVGLWRDAGLVVPQNDPVTDIRRKLRVQPDMFLVGLLGTRIAGTVMVGYEGHRGWINYLAVAPDCRRGGFGRRLLDEAETRLRALGCPKINLQVRNSNTDVIAFYERIGYSIDHVTSMGKRLEDDQHA